MRKITLKIGGMSCSACQNRVEKYLNKQDGVIKASVNLVMANAYIEYEDKLKVKDLERFIKEAGYECLGEYKLDDDKKKNNDEKLRLIIFGILALLVFYISMAHMLGLPKIPFLDMMRHPKSYAISLLILTIPFLVYGKDILVRGIKNLIHLAPNMDSLVTLGVSASFIYSLVNLINFLNNKGDLTNIYFEACAIIIFFIKLGRYIEKTSHEKTKTAIKELVTITPAKAYLKKEQGIEEVTIDEVKKGDILVAKIGTKIAVDGEIIKGCSYIDEAFITGEAKQNKKNIGDKVIAGSKVLNGYIEYKAERIGKDSTISEIVRLVVEASSKKGKLEKLTDRVSGYFTPIIMLLALLSLGGHLIFGSGISAGIKSFVSVLVVACPCSLGLATPIAMVVSLGLCAKKGILVKSSEVIEKADKIKTIIFDKTGTLTYGNLRVAKIYNFSKLPEEELLKMVASIEAKANHPIGKAFINAAKEKKIVLDKTEDFQNMEGIGVKAIYKKDRIYLGNNKLFLELKLENKYQKEEDTLAKEGSSIIYVIKNKNVLALIGVKDIERESAKTTIEVLKKLNKRIVMLTGDNQNTAMMVAQKLGISEVVAGVFPKDKADMIKACKDNKEGVMMVGDGINDAPSLAIADIGVSIRNATDIATDSADVILIDDEIKKIPDFLMIAKRTKTIIKENLFWAFFYNTLMVPIAMGLLENWGIVMNPMWGSLAMMASSLTVVFNSLRLRYFRK